jgi:hypothetical protein
MGSHGFGIIIAAGGPLGYLPDSRKITGRRKVESNYSWIRFEYIGRCRYSQEFSSRPASRTRRKTEEAALHALAGDFSLGLYPTLKRLANLAIELCDAQSAGVSVIEATEMGTLFRWRALAGLVEKCEGGSTPRDWSPCGECLKAGHATLYSYPARYFTYFQEPESPIVEGLVVPVFGERQPLATIWVISHHVGSRFNAEDVRIMLGPLCRHCSQVPIYRQYRAGQ